MPEFETTDLSKLKIQREQPNRNPDAKGFPWILVIVAVIVVAGLFYGYRTWTTPAIVVETTTVTSLTGVQASAALTASGYVVAQRKAAIASKATGRLVSLNYVEGDKVKKNDIIGRIESSDVEAQLEQSKAALKVYEADLADASNSLSRAKQLLDGKLISQSEMDAAQSRYDRVIASIAAAKAVIRQSEVSVENTMIRAPFDGTILTKNADIGEVVSPFSAGASSRVAVVTLADMNSLQVEADVSESNLEKVSIHQPCEITLDAYPDRSYKAHVAKIVPTADRAKATVMTKIQFEQTDSRVLPEMGAKVHFLSEESKQEVNQAPKTMIPVTALATHDGKKVAYIIDNTSVREVPITTGQVQGSLIEVVSGLTSGQKIVNNPSDKLANGSTITIKQ